MARINQQLGIRVPLRGRKLSDDERAVMRGYTSWYLGFESCGLDAWDTLEAFKAGVAFGRVQPALRSAAEPGP